MKNALLNKTLIPQLFFLFSILWTVHPALAKQRYKIGIVHSYEKSYHDAKRYRQILEKELTANGVAFEVKELFLNCNELIYEDELARASFFIDELAKWEVDVIAVFNNQASYSLLKCNNPKLRQIPVVFSGAYHPDTDLISQYPNVTGYVDIPDYTNTVRMIERIMGKSRIVVMSGSGAIDHQMWINLEKQCRDANIETYDGDVLKHILHHRIVENAYEESQEEYYNEQIDTTVVMRLMSEEMPLRTIQQTAKGSETYLMLTAHTYNSIDAPKFFINPSFAVINEGFGSNNKMLGGYFTPLELQLKEMAKGICLRLQGKMPEKQIIQCPKQYVLNWEVLDRYGISTDDLPSEYIVMYIPFMVRYRPYIISGLILGTGLLCAFIIFLIYSLLRERRRKKEALRDLLYEHEKLKLAIKGGTTYVWRKENGCLSFDPDFYKQIAHPSKFITQEQILTFIHPDDRERFTTDFLQNKNENSDCQEQYRCKFNDEYQWWKFHYSFIYDAQKTPIVTGLLQNIQKEKNHEAELIRARNIAEQAELKQSFLNNMGHEIRTPLNSIVGFSNLLINNPDLQEEEKAEFVSIINQNNELLLNIIGDILELSRIDSGTVSFVKEKKELKTLLNSYYQSFCIQIKPNLEFLKDYPDEDIVIQTDSRRLQQVVTNLLANANKFTNSGYIKLGYRYTQGDKIVRIFVEDSGKGIPREEQELIFSRFYKHDEFAQGTGLGLAICRSITGKLGGRINVESEVNKGSRFTIVLPLE